MNPSHSPSSPTDPRRSSLHPTHSRESERERDRDRERDRERDPYGGYEEMDPYADDERGRVVRERLGERDRFASSSSSHRDHRYPSPYPSAHLPPPSHRSHTNGHRDLTPRLPDPISPTQPVVEIPTEFNREDSERYTWREMEMDDIRHRERLRKLEEARYVGGPTSSRSHQQQDRRGEDHYTRMQPSYVGDPISSSGLPPPPMGNVRSRGSRPVSPVTRGDEWASRGRWEKEPEYDERDEEFGDGRERIQSWQDGIHAVERSPYRENVQSATSKLPHASNPRPLPDERYHHDSHLDLLRRQHEENNAKILADAQARYQVAVAEREARELARRRQRSQEKIMRFSELVSEEKERLGRDSWTRDRVEKERMAEQREFEAKVAIQQIEEIAAERLKRIQDEDKRVQEMEKRTVNGREREGSEINGQSRAGPSRLESTGFSSQQTATLMEEDDMTKKSIKRRSESQKMPQNVLEGMDVDSFEAGPSRPLDTRPSDDIDDLMDGIQTDDTAAAAATLVAGSPTAVTNGNGKSSKPPKQEYILPAEEWPTKGIRNKDGSYRKKPGPPKGIKKPPPKNRPVQPDEIARRAMLHNISGTVDSELLEAASEAESSIAGSARNTSKRRKLQHAAAELDDTSSESGLPLESTAGGHRSELRCSPQAFDAVDDELDQLYTGEMRGRGDGLDNELVDTTDSKSRRRRRHSRDKAGSVRSGNSDWDPWDESNGQPADTFGPGESLRNKGNTRERSHSIQSIASGDVQIATGTAIRRHQQVQYMQHVIWHDISKYQIPKVHRYVLAACSNRQSNAARVAAAAAKTQRRYAARPGRTVKEMQLRARRTAKEAQMYWKKNEKDELELRKKAEREAIEQAKAVEAAREKRRAERKLNFLLSSGELYSHFMQKKIKTNEAADAPEASISALPGALADATDIDHETIGDIDFDDDDDEKHDALLRQHAAARAKAVMNENLNKAADFDEQVSAERAQAEMAGEMNSEAPDELDFQNPLAGEDQEAISQPKMLMAQLKEYQLKGLSWLGNLYEQGINGILADEMGLGKTIQSISLLAYLAEKHNIWGPFLVVAPASTVHNWQQELSRFVPKLKALPYWGQPNDRKILRKDWNRKSIIFTEDAPFHIVVTSYDMAVLDASYFSKVRWQYMILDEAQAVKNSQSLRWNTLLSLKCRNRLLLTGTPIQNSMQELWALLHFIMPQLFDSHEDFSEWFSKGIEGAAGGRDNNLSSHQLKRLHEVLRPFMLRRVKKNVQSELGEKIEIDLRVELSPRQKVIYRALRSSASIRALLAQASDSQDSNKVNSLMNIVMQFRKVCNHPYLFERADVASPFSFGQFSSSGNLLRQDGLYCPAPTRNPITLQIPKLLWQDGGILSKPDEKTRAGFDTRYLQNLLSIWSPDHMAESMKEESSEFAFCSLLDKTPAYVSQLAHNNTMGRLLQASKEAREAVERAPYTSEVQMPNHRFKLGPIVPRTALQPLAPNGLARLDNIARNHWHASWLRQPDAHFFIEPAVAPPISAECSSRSFLDTQRQARSDPKANLALFGLPAWMRDDPKAVEAVEEFIPGAPAEGLFRVTPLDQAPSPAMRFPDMKRLIFDSAKLARLDSLLRELKAGGHRVLIYFQMTRMMSIMEEYLIYRQYKYLRLDGASVIADRRDMVNAWQTNPELFVFLLSTKAGGLGINLTAADTVIFYDHDWNPSNDSQAMDRAHRLGQTRQVTVYRLIARGTVDERILHLARGKKDVQDIVVGNKSLADITSQKEIVSLLFDDEELAGSGPADGYAANSKFGASIGAVDVDEDDFFGVTTKKKVPGDGDEEALVGEVDNQAKKKKTPKPKGTKPKGKRAAADTDSIAGGSSPQPPNKKPKVVKPKASTGKKSKLATMETATGSVSGQVTPANMTPMYGMSREGTPKTLA